MMSKYMDIRELFPGGKKDEWHDRFGRTRDEIRAAESEFKQRIVAIKRAQYMYHPKSLSETLGKYILIKQITVGDE